MHEGAPQPHEQPYSPYDNESFEVSPRTKSPMEQELDFNVDVVFDDLEKIIPEFNQYVNANGGEVSEEMRQLQNEALNTMRGIKNSNISKPKSKGELIKELEKRTNDPNIMLSAEARKLIEGIL